MLLIIEIILTVYIAVLFDRLKLSWAWALIPTVGGFVFAILMGLVLAAIHVSATTALILGLLLDGFIILVLISMIIGIKRYIKTEHLDHL